MRAPISRRGFVQGAAAVIGGLAALTRGWVPWRQPLAYAAIRWTVRVPMSGQVGSLNFHCSGTVPCDNALDFFYRNPPNDTKVKLYILSDTGLVGYGGILSFEPTCSDVSNLDHKRMKVNIATNNFVLLGVAGISHIIPTVSVGQLVGANGGQLGKVRTDDVSVPACYDRTHVHFGIINQTPTMDPIGSWINQYVTAGNEAPWEKSI